MKNIIFVLLTIGISLSGYAQKKGTTSGILYDSILQEPIPAATITVLNKKDSSLISFTMSGKEGKFTIANIAEGEYRLLITHINYHNHTLFFTIHEDSLIKDWGKLYLLDKAQTLEEVVVVSEAPPVTMVGDTIQYHADAFKTAPNANVEELLKKLPGVQVEKDGTVKAQGESVTRVLVDGKEFFGNDPKIATRNLPADAVEKVQVFDKKSDQAMLTGFDDGAYEKTINLKLKKDKKKGLFGKITGGAGDRERFDGKFNINSFKGARQLSAIGMANNTNAEGFSFMDMLNFSGGLGQMMQQGGGSFSLPAAEAGLMGLSGNRGINTSFGGGINYNNIIGNKNDFQSNYFYNHFNPEITQRVYRQNRVQGRSNFEESNSFSDNINNSHRLAINNLYQIDSMHSLRINPSFSYQTTNNRSRTISKTIDENGDYINEGANNNNSHSQGYNFRNELVFRKKFNRAGRTFSLTWQNTINQSTGTGALSSIYNYYNNGSAFRKDTLNQQNETESSANSYTVRAVYTEPIWKRSLLELSAARSGSKNISEKSTYDFNSSSGKHDIINEDLTNNFENRYNNTNAGMRIRKQAANFNYSVGLTWQQAALEGKIISDTKDSVISQTFKNILPNASFRYNFSRFKTLNINYSTSTNQPTVSQLQPVPDNSNPLYVREGNPDLKQEFTHNIRTSLNLISPFSGKNFFFFINGSTTNNKIASFDSLDLTTGKRKTKPVNVDGVYNISGNLSYSFPIRPIGATVDISNMVRWARNNGFINMLKNRINTFTWGPQVRLDMNPTEKINIGFAASYTFNEAKYSAQPLQNNRFWMQEYDASIDWKLPANFFISTSLNYNINDQLTEGFNARVPLWNASISKQFLKYNRGELKLAATDLLNRNINVSRTTGANYIEDREINSLRRFFMLSFTYSLSKAGLGARQGGPMIIQTR